MKKKYVLATSLLFCTQTLFPLTSLAESSTSTTQEWTSEKSTSKNDYQTNSTDASVETVDEPKNQMSDYSNEQNISQESHKQTADEAPFAEENNIDTWMPDKNLQQIVSDILGKDNFTQEDMLSITSASIDSKVISNIQGISFAKNLTYLSVTNTDLSSTSNLSEIGTLTNLKKIIANGDSLSDISFIKNNNLASLEYADLSNNLLPDLNSIAGISLPRLSYLDVSHNLIADISILENADVPSLQSLLASYNKISDISPIAHSTLTNLKILDASHNLIQNVDAFANSTFLKLEQLIINDNQISNISVMKNLTDRYPNLHVYNVDNNHINNIEFMEGYRLNSATSAKNQTYTQNISLVKPLNNTNNQYKVAVPITSLDYQYSNSAGFYAGTPDPLATTLTLYNIQGPSSLSLTNGIIINNTVDSYPNSVHSFIIDASTSNLPSQITFNWSGAQGQFSGSAAISINWVDAQAPVIEANDQTLYVGDKFDASNYAKAYDQQLDGSQQIDLTNQINVVKNNVNTNVPGNYSVTYDVTNTYGIKTTKTILVTVKENKQSIDGSNFSMYVGDKDATTADFKPSATDKEGNSIDVTADLSKVDFSKPGTYDIVLTATDGQTKTVTLTIKENKQSINGSDFSMYVGDKDATTADFKPSATNKDGKSIDVTADFSKVDFSKVGTYDVVLTATDGQTKTVTLTIKEKVTVPTTNSTSRSSTGSMSVPSKAGTTSAASDKSLPNTGGTNSPLLTIIGFMMLLSGGAYVLTLKCKKNN